MWHVHFPRKESTTRNNMIPELEQRNPRPCVCYSLLQSLLAISPTVEDDGTACCPKSRPWGEKIPSCDSWNGGLQEIPPCSITPDFLSAVKNHKESGPVETCLTRLDGLCLCGVFLRIRHGPLKYVSPQGKHRLDLRGLIEMTSWLASGNV